MPLLNRAAAANDDDAGECAGFSRVFFVASAHLEWLSDK